MSESSPNQHRPWCTDHLSEDPTDPLTEGDNVCVTAIYNVAGLPGVGAWVEQTPEATEPSLVVEVNAGPTGLTAAQARQLHTALGELLDRITPPEHTEESDDTALDEASDLPDAFNRSGVIPLPDPQAGKAKRWTDSGSDPGHSPDDN